MFSNFSESNSNNWFHSKPLSEENPRLIFALRIMGFDADAKRVILERTYCLISAMHTTRLEHMLYWLKGCC